MTDVPQAALTQATRESRRLEKALGEARVALERVASWLESFSVPPTSTIREKENALALIKATLAAIHPGGSPDA